MQAQTARCGRKSAYRSQALLLAVLAAASFGLRADQAGKPEKLFESEQTLAVTLTAPWQTLMRDKDFQGAYPARISYADGNGAQVTLDLTAGRRGITRQRVCDFPPIRLRFDKAAVKGTVFRGQKSLKLVTHCEKSSRYDQYVVLEMLAYRMYNLLTDASFRVRPLQATYIDSDSGEEVDSRFAFLVEDDSDVAKRNGLEKVDVGRIPVSRLQRQQTGQLALFQYMISNMDWAATAGPDPAECCHNIKLIAPEPLDSGSNIVPVPYDFDSAGLVDAPYAVPAQELGIKKVTQRVYRGYCLHNDTLPEARRVLREQRPRFQALIDGDERLDSKSKRKASRLIEGYFSIDESERKFDRYVIERCRK